jgi:FkbM family methyltransferase
MLRTLNFILDHPISGRRPVAALGRYISWQVRSRLKEEVCFSWLNGSMLVVRQGMTGATGNVYCGLHEFVDMAFLLHLLRPNDLFVDAGANVGCFTVLAAKVCEARCISIEPDPLTVRRLRRNVAANRIEELVSIEETAVGATSGVVNLTIGSDTMNHVVPESSEKTRTVRLTPLDLVIGTGHPVMIKMDLEGYEAEALKGAQNILQRKSLLALEIETINRPIKTMLEHAGFIRSFYDPFERRLTPEPTSLRGHNALYIRDIEQVRKRVRQAKRRRVYGVDF